MQIWSNVITRVISILFNCIDTLLNCRPAPPHASCVYNEVFSNRINSFLMEKINTICFSIVDDFDADILCPLSDVVSCKCEFLCFQTITQDQVSKFVNSSMINSCDLDPMPVTMLKNYWPVSLPVINEAVRLCHHAWDAENCTDVSSSEEDKPWSWGL